MIILNNNTEKISWTILLTVQFIYPSILANPGLSELNRYIILLQYILIKVAKFS